MTYNDILNHDENWRNRHRLPENERGKKFMVLTKEGLTPFYEEPPFGRNDDGSSVFPPDFAAGI